MKKGSGFFYIFVILGTTTGPDRIKGLLPSGTKVAHKTGSSGQNKAGITYACNDAGIIEMPDGQQFVLVVFVTDSKESEATNARIIAQIAQNVYNYFEKK